MSYLPIEESVLIDISLTDNLNLNEININISDYVKQYLGIDYYMIRNSDYNSSFVDAILFNIYDNYKLLPDSSKCELKCDLFSKLKYDLVDKDLYFKFGYNTKKLYSKKKIINLLSKSDININNNNILKQYIVDYFDINVVIFNITYKCISSYMSNDGGIAKCKSTILIVCEDIYNNNNYYSIVSSNNIGIFNNSNNSKICELYNEIDNQLDD